MTGRLDRIERVLLVILGLTGLSLGRHLCPPNIAPCVCAVKQNLVVTCQNTNIETIQHAMKSFKEQPGTEISYLTLKGNNMARLPDFLFTSMDIRHLFISKTNLAILEEASLTAISGKLEFLDLPENRISVIPSKALSHLRTTRILNIQHNTISAIHGKAFAGMTQIQRLSLYGNQIQQIESNAFEGVERELIYLNLGGNRLNRVPTQAISKLQNLITLELEKNRIESIKESDFQGLSNLDTLKLGQNMISELGPNVFKALPRMSSLDLESNRIHMIDPKAFLGLEERLEWLKLGNNSIHEIPSVALEPMHRLREFDMKANNITELKDTSFRGFGNTLKYLLLDNNMIDTIPLSAFSDMHSLEVIKLSNNKIKHLPPQAFQSITETKAFIDVHGNELQCDCDLMWYKQWLIKAEKSSIKDNEARPLIGKTKCWSSRDKHEYMVMQAPLDRLYCPSDTTTGSGTRIETLLPTFTSLYTILCFHFTIF